MSNCLFCKIIKGDIPCEKVYEDDFVIAFKDIYPLAKIHLLFVHKNHTKDINEMMESDPQQIAQLYYAMSKHSKASGLAESGYRVVTNLGKNGGQEVFHTHFHMLGGERLKGFGA